MVQLFVDVGSGVVEIKKCILAQDLIIVEVKWISGFCGGVGVFCILNGVVFDAENILDEGQVGPGMVKHGL